MPVVVVPETPQAQPPPGVVLRSQESADRLLEALWRARVALNISRKRQRVGSPRYAVVPG